LTTRGEDANRFLLGLETPHAISETMNQ
jgi:hypothetical protein